MGILLYLPESNKKAWGTPYPGNLKQKFVKAESHFQYTPPDTNQYFLPLPVITPKGYIFWKDLTTLKPWNLKDDKELKSSDEICMIEDGTNETFYLITKSGIKSLNFYEPGFECNAKDTNRQRAVKLRDMILKEFKAAQEFKNRLP